MDSLWSIVSQNGNQVLLLNEHCKFMGIGVERKSNLKLLLVPTLQTQNGVLSKNGGGATLVCPDFQRQKGMRLNLLRLVLVLSAAGSAD